MHTVTLALESFPNELPPPVLAEGLAALDDRGAPAPGPAPEMPGALLTAPGTEPVAEAVAPEVPAPVLALRRFRAIFGAVRRHFQEVERRCGVPGSQLWALSVIVAMPGIRVKDLALAMAIHQSTASNLIEQLARQGLLRRERDRSDQRIVMLHATDAGRGVVDLAPRPLDGLLPDALASLDPARLALLNDLLAEVAEGMRARP